MKDRELAAAVAAHKWYHTMELPDGTVTPGYYDLRQALPHMPWPEVKGKRCLDIGTFDGFYAFELERRGASEVIAIDVDDYAELDWPARTRANATAELAALIGEDRGRGFRIAAAALGSQVKRVPLNVYDLSPDSVGTFDVVVIGSILTHLRDPLRALEAIRSVCRGQLLIAEGFDLWLTVRHPRRPLLDFPSSGDQWFAPNRAGLERLLYVGGFGIERRSKPYSLKFGPGGRVGLRATLGRIRRAGPKTAGRNLWRIAVRLILTGHAGPAHLAILAHPEV